MKSKITWIVMLSLLLFFVALSIFFGYFYYQRGKTIDSLNAGYEVLQNNSQDAEQSTQDSNQEVTEKIVEKIKYMPAGYDKDKIVNSTSEYSDHYEVGTWRGELKVEDTKVTLSISNDLENYYETRTFNLDEKVVDVCTTMGGQGTYEQTAFITESGKVYINYTADDNAVIELTNMHKMCRVVATTANIATQGTYTVGALIGIDEDGNCYDLGVARTELEPQ